MRQAVRLAAELPLETVLGFEAHGQAASAFNPGVIESILATGHTTRR